MSEMVRTITLRARYRSDLRGLRDDIRTLKSVRRQLEKTPVLLPVKLDLSRLKSEAAKAATEYANALKTATAKVKPGETMSGGGVILPPSVAAKTEESLKKIKHAAKAAGDAYKTIFEFDGLPGGKPKATTTFRELERGLKEIEKRRHTQKGDKVTSRVEDTRQSAAIRSALESTNAFFAADIGAARGSRGDLADVLRRKRDRLNAEVDKLKKDFSDIGSDPEFVKINKAFDRLNQQISQAEEAQQLRKNRSTRKISVDLMKSRMTRIDQRYAKVLGSTQGNQGDVARVLRSKRDAIAKELASWGSLADLPEFRTAQKSLSRINQQIERTTGAQGLRGEARRKARFNTRTTRLLARADDDLQSKIKANKTDEAAARAIENRLVREAEINRILNERESIYRRHEARLDQHAAIAQKAGVLGARDRFLTASGTVAGQRETFMKDRAAAESRGTVKEREAGLSRQIKLIKMRHQLDRESLNSEEKAARAIKNQTRRQEALNDVLQRRIALAQRSQAAFAGVASRAREGGMSPVEDKAMIQRGAIFREMERDQRLLTAATNKSGHAFNFHTSSLLRNAATFTKWYIPAQASMALFRVLGTGTRQAVDAQRQFRILRAVYQGNAEDAKLLADQSLTLAAANARSAAEAADAAISWSRLGFTRTQVLLAMETSLKAANVAEIEAGQATEYLTGIYKGFGLTIAEIPEVLDYLNALSNKNKVRVTDLFEAYAKAGEIVKQAGMNYQEFGAIVTAVSDNSKVSGAEIGNAIKFVAQRIRRPEQITKLESEFGVNLRTATGDVKDLGDIFAELARVYPTLNKSEKARVQELAAGSRQANRFSLVLDNLTNAYIAQARAAMDANSAARENQQIMTSLGATIDKLETSWVRWLHTLGEAGAFDAARDNLESLMERAKMVGDLLMQLNNGSAPAARDIEVGSRPLRRAISLAGNLDRTGIARMQTNRQRDNTDTYERRFSAGQIRGAKANLESLRTLMTSHDSDQIGTARKDLIERGGFLPGMVDRMHEEAVRGRLTFANGVTDDYGDRAGVLQAIETFIADFENLLVGDFATKLGDSAVRAARQAVQNETHLEGLLAGRNAYRSMAAEARNPTPDRSRLLRQFDAALPTLEMLPEGAAGMAAARNEIRPLLESRQYEEAAKKLEELERRMLDTYERLAPEFAALRTASAENLAASLDESRAQVTKLNEEMARAPGGDRQRQLQTEIETTNEKIKQQQELLRSLMRDEKTPGGSAMDSFAGAELRTRISRTLLAGQVSGEAYSGLDTGDPMLNAKLKLGGLLRQADFMDAYAGMTRPRVDAQLPGLHQQLAIAESMADTRTGAPDEAAHRQHVRDLRQKIDLLTEGQALIETEARKAREAADEAARRLNYERELLGIRESFEQGTSRVAAQSEMFAVGPNDSARLVNQVRANLGATSGDFDAFRYGQGDSPEAQAERLGRMTERMRQSKEGVVNIEARLYTLTAQRANLEYEIAEQQREQAKEASKRLAMASREDQLRAAAARAFFRNNGGGIGIEQFQFLSQGTRGAISNFLPGNVRGLDDPETANREARQKLDQEIDLLRGSLEPLREQFITLRDTIRQFAPLLPKPGEGTFAPGGATGSDKGVRVDLKTGPVQINVNIAEQIDRLRRLLSHDVNAAVTAQLDRIARSLRSADPDTAAAAGAF